MQEQGSAMEGNEEKAKDGIHAARDGRVTTGSGQGAPSGGRGTDAVAPRGQQQHGEQQQQTRSRSHSSASSNPSEEPASSRVATSSSTTAKSTRAGKAELAGATPAATPSGTDTGAAGAGKPQVLLVSRRTGLPLPSGLLGLLLTSSSAFSALSRVRPQAVYANTPVYELLVRRGNSVMRRRADGWVNASQLLKVAGVTKAQRAKTLERDVAHPDSGVEHESLGPAHGRCEGVWMPAHDAEKMAGQHGVFEVVRPLFEYSPPAAVGDTAAVFTPAATPSLQASGPQPQSQSQSPSPPVASQRSPPPSSSAAAQPLQSAQKQPPHQNGGPLAPTKANGQKRPPATVKEDIKGKRSSTTTNVNSRKRPRQAAESAPVPVPAETSTSGTAASNGGPESAGETSSGQGSSNKRARVDGLAPPKGSASGPSAPLAEGNGLPHTSDASTSTVPVQLQQIHRATKHSDVAGPTSAEHREALMSLFIIDADMPAGPTAGAAPAGAGADADADAGVEADTGSSGRAPASGEMDPSAVVSGFPAGLDANAPIDEQQHTALHWAAALGRLSTVQALLGAGALPDRGNASGETPLMRAVLVTNNFDAESFAPASPLVPGLLDLLSGSMFAVDDQLRSVLHHIALVAGIRGRSAAARHYMETVLHWLAEHAHAASAAGPAATGAPLSSAARRSASSESHTSRVAAAGAASRSASASGPAPAGTGTGPALPETGRTALNDLLDAKDANGDTALNIAARVGSRPIVRMLLESGANANLPNNLGLRPGDFGFLEEGLTVPTPAELAVEQLQLQPSGNSSSLAVAGPSSASAPGPADGATREMQSRDLLATLGTLLTSLSADFSAELAARGEALQRTRERLHAATRELAERRSALIGLREEVRALEATRWRIRNLEQAIEEEDRFDWTGRTGVDGEPEYPPDASAAATGKGLDGSTGGKARPGKQANAQSGEGTGDGEDELGEDQKRIHAAAFEYRGAGSTLGALPAVSMPMTIEADPPLPAAASPPSSQITGGGAPGPGPGPGPAATQVTLAQLRRMEIWYTRVLALLRARIAHTRERTAAGGLELEARRLVKLCTGVSADEEIENMLGNLIVALESDEPAAANSASVHVSANAEGGSSSAGKGAGAGGLDLQR